MIIYPAIDIKDGNCVRLKQGNMDEETIFSVDPAKQARHWENMGFQWLHVVDLNGAVEGKPRNIYAVQKIIHAVKIPVQLGGGIRDVQTAESWFEAGVSRLILGTIAIEAPKIVEELCQKYPGKIAVGIDAKNGMVATRGWIRKTKTSAVELAKKFEDKGVAAIIYTDIDRDGLMGGPNIIETLELAQAVKIPIIISGGISSTEDVRRVNETGKIAGAVIGRALYDGSIDPIEVLAV